MIFSVVLFDFANDARCTFHGYLVVDVSVVSHLYRVAVEIEHLAIYEVISLSFNLRGSRGLVVHDAANLVLYSPVSDNVVI